ncbi:MAG: hypothetical protein ACK5L3_14740 [Oscillospiraceae bacterium]
MKAKTLRVSSVFPAAVDDIWNKIQRLETLQYIAAPYATFTPQDKGMLLWQKGHRADFQLKLFGLFPMGIHSIAVVQFDRDTLSIYTNERNRSVPVWNHRILIEPTGAAACRYTDEVEIMAGWKTIFVFWWSGLFYRHRQKKWKKLLAEK